MKSIAIVIACLLIALLQNCGTGKVSLAPNPNCCAPRGGILDSTVNSPTGTLDYKEKTSEYAPVVEFGETEDILWFSSNRFVTGKLPTNKPAEIFYSSRPVNFRDSLPNIGWSKPVKLHTDNLDFDRLARGTIALYKNSMVVSSEKLIISGQDVGTSQRNDLWQLNKSGISVRNPKLIDELVSEEWNSQPAFSNDGKVMFFVQKNPDTQENQHIWYSVRGSDGKWLKPKPLEWINSKGNDISPHCSPDGKFYFASDRTGGEGGYDIYVAEFNKTVDGVLLPSKPKNLNEIMLAKSRFGSEPMLVNTTADEAFPFISPDGSAIYFSSNRKDGYGDYDIYACFFPDPVIRLVTTVMVKVGDRPYHPEVMKITLYEPDRTIDTIYNSIIDTIFLEQNRIITNEKSTFENSCYDCECYSRDTIKTFFHKDSLILDTIWCQCQPKQQDQVVIKDTLGIPFFVTGYWKPTTTTNLNELYVLLGRGKLPDANFIQTNDYKYDTITTYIEKFFDVNIYNRLKNKVNMLSNCWDTLSLKITIHGFTDKRGLRPGKFNIIETLNIGGLLIPPDVSSTSKYLNDEQGQRIALPDTGQRGNVILSKLRAYYTFKTIDEEMKTRDSLYKALYEKGRIVYDCEGFGVYDLPLDISSEAGDKILPTQPAYNDPMNEPSKRRIIVYFDVMKTDEVKRHFITKDGRTNFKMEKKPITIIDETKEKPEKEEIQVEEIIEYKYFIVYGTAKEREDLNKLRDFLKLSGFEIYDDTTEIAEMDYPALLSPPYDNLMDAVAARKAYESKVTGFRVLVPNVNYYDKIKILKRAMKGKMEFESADTKKPSKTTPVEKPAIKETPKPEQIKPAKPITETKPKEEPIKETIPPVKTTPVAPVVQEPKTEPKTFIEEPSSSGNKYFIEYGTANNIDDLKRFQINLNNNSFESFIDSSRTPYTILSNPFNTLEEAIRARTEYLNVIEKTRFNLLSPNITFYEQPRIFKKSVKKLMKR